MLLKTYADTIARAALFGNRAGNDDYRLRVLYIEFENVASPGDAVSVPTITSDSDGVDYYLGLAGDRDFVRVLLNKTDVSVEPNAEDEESLPEGYGNEMIFRALSAAAEGYNSVEFSAAANSKICGIAIGAAPSSSDATQDVIIDRSYYEVADQFIRPASASVNVRARIRLPLPS